MFVDLSSVWVTPPRNTHKFLHAVWFRAVQFTIWAKFPLPVHIGIGARPFDENVLKFRNEQLTVLRMGALCERSTPVMTSVTLLLRVACVDSSSHQKGAHG